MFIWWFSCKKMVWRVACSISCCLRICGLWDLYWIHICHGAAIGLCLRSRYINISNILLLSTRPLSCVWSSIMSCVPTWHCMPIASTSFAILQGRGCQDGSHPGTPWSLPKACGVSPAGGFCLASSKPLYLGSHQETQRGSSSFPWGTCPKPRVSFARGLSLWNMVVSHGTSTLGSKSMIGGGSHSHRNLWFHFGGASQLKMITVWSSAPSPYRAWAPISNSHASPTWARLAPMKPWFARKLILQQMTKEMENQPSQAPKKRRKAWGKSIHQQDGNHADSHNGEKRGMQHSFSHWHCSHHWHYILLFACHYSQ